ncbi:Acyltransferase family protein [compost metagenome]
MLAVWNPARPKKIISDAAEFIGIALIGYSLLLFNKHTVFPGLSAALPTIGTALLMFAGGNGRGFSQVLKSKSMVWIGLVSYSLYLWHWPIIVFIKLINPGAEAGLMAFGLFVSLLASIFSYIYVENCLEKSV